MKANYHLSNTSKGKNVNGYNTKTRVNSLKEDMQQKWTRNQGTQIYYDQYGFEISYGVPFKLFWHGTLVAHCLSLAAAKEISLILVNDIILHKQI